MDRPIGDIFEFEGVRLKVEESHTCTNCFLKNSSYCYNKTITGYCGAIRRKDKKDVSFVKIEENMFTKDDLKNGHIIVCDNGSTYMVVSNPEVGMFLTNNESWKPLSDYTKDLKHERFAPNSIKEVYKGCEYGFNFSALLTHKGTLLWKRPAEKVELTLEQIAEKFNIPVDSLRIKD